MADLTAVPTVITAGDSYTLTLTASAYPASAGWALSLAVAGAAVQSWTSTASGDAHVLTLTAAQTAALTAGSYQVRVRAIRSGVVDTIQTGTLTVQPDVFTAAAGGLRSYWEQLKVAAETALLTLMESNAPQMLTVMGRQTMFRSPQEIRDIIAECNGEIAKLRNNGRRTQMSFVASGYPPQDGWV